MKWLAPGLAAVVCGLLIGAHPGSTVGGFLLGMGLAVVAVRTWEVNTRGGAHRDR